MTSPRAVHCGANDLPFVDIGDGSALKVLQVRTGEEQGLPGPDVLVTD
jgi:2,4'-dihydroxyacetophenone dioxygenase